MKPRVLFYVQHLLGIGHIVRAFRIARALRADNFAVRLVMGGMPVAGMDLHDLDIVQLPPVQAAGGFTDLVDETGARVDQSFWSRRARLLLDQFTSFAPDILLIEAYPFGRRQMRYELLPLLDETRQATPRPLVVTSVRDILQENRKPKRLEETLDILNRYFDLVLVHGDDRINVLSDTFPLADKITGEVSYTGIVAGAKPPAPRQRYDVIVSAGGGAVGEALLLASLEARAQTSLAAARWLMVTGPNLPQGTFDMLVKRAPAGVEVERFRSDLDGLLYDARISISQCGYNTIADILRAGCASVVVPFSAGGESEQTRRATALSAMGRATMVSEQDVSPEALAAAVETALSFDQHSGEPDINLNGAATSAAILRRSLSAHAARRKKELE